MVLYLESYGMQQEVSRLRKNMRQNIWGVESLAGPQGSFLLYSACLGDAGEFY